MNAEEQKLAVINAETAVSVEPTNSEGYVELGIAYFHADQLDEAMVAFHRAIELNPDSARAYSWMGRIYYHTGPPEMAVDAYQRAIALDRHHINAYYGLGILHSAQLGEYEAAVQAFQHGLEHNPGEPFLVASLGSTYARMGRFDEAIATLQQAIDADNDSVFAIGNLSIVYLHEMRFDEMIAACEREIEIEDHHDARRMLGYVYDRLARHDEAIHQLERSVALEPHDYEARGALARVYRSVGRQLEADKQYAIADGMARQDDEYGQACFEAVSGNVEQAVTLLDVALTKGQVQKGWIRIDPEFAFMQDDPRFQALIEDQR